MDEQQGQPQENNGGNTQPPMTRNVLGSGEQHQTPAGNANTGEPQYIKDGLIKRNWNRFIGGGGDRQVELVLAFAITFFAAAQWITSCENNSSTGDQTDKLISASQRNERASSKIADASKRNAAAAASFSESAKSINEGISNAVDKLSLQTGETHSLAAQAKRSADIAQTAIEVSERPWVGVFNIVIKDDIVEGKKLSGQANIQNFGKAPALHATSIFRIYSVCERITDNFHPAYGEITNPSNTIIFPGPPLPMQETLNPDPITGADLKALEPPQCGLYAFARITYDDTFGHSHWRHYCSFWDKKTPREFDICSAYNDGDENYKDGKEP